jgi:hypothetical protein
MLWTDAGGRPIALLAALGAVGMVVASPARALLLLAFPVPFLFFISNTAPASRYLNPILPFVVLFAAWAIAQLTARLGNRPVVFWVLAAVAAAPAVRASIATDMFFRQADTRTLAQHFIEANVPSGSTILTQPHSAALTPSKAGLVEALSKNVGGADAASIKFRLQLSIDPYPEPSYRLIYLGRGGLDAEKIYVDPSSLGTPQGMDALRGLGVAYVLIKRYNNLDPETQPFLTQLAREGRRLAAFSPYRPGLDEAEQARIDPFLHNTDARIDDALERPGPRMEIWAIDGHGPKR